MRFREDITIVSPGKEDITVKGTLQNVGRTEDAAEGNISVTDWLLFLPVGTAITVKSRVQGRGMEFEVVGMPDELRNELTTNSLHHIEVPLKITGTGTTESEEDFSSDESF